MIKPLLVAVILPFASHGMSTPLNALRGAGECRPVAEEYIDFSRCGIDSRIALAFEVAPTEAPAYEQGDSTLNVKKEATEINLFPNPVTGDNLFVDLRGNGEEGTREVRVYNILGRDIIRQSLEGGRNQISISGLNEGIYFVDVVQGGKVIRTVKLIRK